MTESNPETRRELRPHIGIHFKCCNVYAHAFLNAQKTAFVGWCPRCAGRLEVKVDPSGTDARFFEAG